MREEIGDEIGQKRAERQERRGEMSKGYLRGID